MRRSQSPHLCPGSEREREIERERERLSLLAYDFETNQSDRHARNCS